MNYIRRSEEGIQVATDNNIEYIQDGIINYVNKLCVENLSTYKGRLDASKRIIGSNSKLPIYINDKMILFPDKSIRNYDCILINFLAILSYSKGNDKDCKIVFKDLSSIIVNTSVQVITNQIMKTEELLNKSLKKKVFTLHTY